MKLLLDGDILVYQAIMPSTVWKVIGDDGSHSRYFTSKRDADMYESLIHSSYRTSPDRFIKKISNYPNPATVRTQLKSMVGDILRDVPVNAVHAGINERIDSYLLLLKGDKKNYRSEHIRQVPYKANRPEKPQQYELAREILAEQNPVVYANGQETDDLLGIMQGELKGHSIIVSKDKDLLTIPGWNYNPFHKRLVYISEEEANRNFYTQILTGDRADNIGGLRGIGPVKAKKILENTYTPFYMLSKVLKAFEDKGYHRDDAKALVDELGKLMFIRRTRNQIWSVENVLRG